MKILETIINTYVKGIHFFNLEDDIECFYMIQNFKQSCLQLYFSNELSSDIASELIKIAKQKDTFQIIDLLKQLRKNINT